MIETKCAMILSASEKHLEKPLEVLIMNKVVEFLNANPVQYLAKRKSRQTAIAHKFIGSAS